MDDLDKPIAEGPLNDLDTGELYGCWSRYEKGTCFDDMMEFEPGSAIGELHLHCSDCYGEECPHWIREKQIRPNRPSPWGFTLDCHKQIG